MTALYTLSELARSFFSLWTLVLCLVGVFGVILSTAQKRYFAAVLAALPFFCDYFLWQVLFDLHLLGGGANAVSRVFGGLPYLSWTALLLLLSLWQAVLLVRTVRYGKRSVTPAAVKLCLDGMPCGVCCWRKSGRVLFSNICMNRLCADMTGAPLLDGNAFCGAVSDDIRAVGEKVWRFTCREFLFDGEPLYEMIASDITAEYAKTQALERDKAELSRVKSELSDYTLGLDDAVRRREILQAKVNIHDEMNRLMLSTVAAQSEDASSLDPIFSLWEQNALLLCMEADEKTDEKAKERVEQLAGALKIALSWQGTLPASLTDRQRELLFAASREAIANAAKHAHAKTMEVSFEETDASVSCAFTNDGAMPKVPLRFSGGLANLALLAKRQGADVTATVHERFTLTLTFPRSVQ